MNAQPWDEFCPRCGHWHAALKDRTGWCADCSTEEARYGQVCIRCLRPRPASYYRAGSSYKGKVCRACRTKVRQAWRAANLERDQATEKARNARRRAERLAATPTSGTQPGTIQP